MILPTEVSAHSPVEMFPHRYELGFRPATNSSNRKSSDENNTFPPTRSPSTHEPRIYFPGFVRERRTRLSYSSLRISAYFYTYLFVHLYSTRHYKWLFVFPPLCIIAGRKMNVGRYSSSSLRFSEWPSRRLL